MLACTVFVSVASADVSNIVQEAVRLYNRGEYKAALQQAGQAPSNSVPALNVAALCLAHQKKWDDAIATLQKAVTLDPTSLVIRFNLGEVFLTMGKYQDAFSQYEQCLGIMPGDGLIRFRAFLCLVLDKQNEKATAWLATFQPAMNNPSYYYSQAAWHFSRSDEEAALFFLLSAREQFTPIRNYPYAVALMEQGWIPQESEPAR